MSVSPTPSMSIALPVTDNLLRALDTASGPIVLLDTSFVEVPFGAVASLPSLFLSLLLSFPFIYSSASLKGAEYIPEELGKHGV